jgi:hypothetical protein
MTTSVISRWIVPAWVSARRMASAGRGGSNDLIPQLFEHGLGNGENGRFVFHEQNGFASAERGGGRQERVGGSGRGLCEAGQVDGERAAVAGFALDIDEAVVLLTMP